MTPEELLNEHVATYRPGPSKPRSATRACSVATPSPARRWTKSASLALYSRYESRLPQMHERAVRPSGSRKNKNTKRSHFDPIKMGLKDMNSILSTKRCRLENKPEEPQFTARPAQPSTPSACSARTPGTRHYSGSRSRSRSRSVRSDSTCATGIVYTLLVPGINNSPFGFVCTRRASRYIIHALGVLGQVSAFRPSMQEERRVRGDRNSLCPSIS